MVLQKVYGYLLSKTNQFITHRDPNVVWCRISAIIFQRNLNIACLSEMIFHVHVVWHAP